MAKVRVVVEIRDGVCTDVYADAPIEVTIVDYDSLALEGIDEDSDQFVQHVQAGAYTVGANLLSEWPYSPYVPASAEET